MNTGSFLLSVVHYESHCKRVPNKGVNLRAYFMLLGESNMRNVMWFGL